jgi:6-phosphogluconate dehydrogenase
MGGDLALQCVDKGIDVLGHAKHGHPALAAQGVKIAVTYDAFARALKPPRVIYLSLPAGAAVAEARVRRSSFRAGQSHRKRTENQPDH